MSVELELPGSLDSLPSRVEKPWGHELIWANNRHYAGKILHVRAGHRLSLQYHERKHETLMVLSGRVRMTLSTPGGELVYVDAPAGQVFEVAPGRVHRIEAIETSEMLEVSTPELDDVVRLSDDYGRSDED